MHEVLGLIARFVSKQTFCIFMYVPVHTKNMPGLSWQILVEFFERVCTRLSPVQDRAASLYDTMLWYCTALYQHISVHTAINWTGP